MRLRSLATGAGTPVVIVEVPEAAVYAGNIATLVEALDGRSVYLFGLPDDMVGECPRRVDVRKAEQFPERLRDEVRSAERDSEGF